MSREYRSLALSLTLLHPHARQLLGMSGRHHLGRRGSFRDMHNLWNPDRSIPVYSNISGLPERVFPFESTLGPCCSHNPQSFT